MIKRLLLTTLLCTGIMSVADEAPAPDANTPTTLPKGALTCPAADKLTKDPKTLLWSDGKNFKSFSTSFANKMKGFVGAQWQGVNVGKMECVYQPENAYTFTVILYFGHLAHEPTSAGWGPNKGGFRNCLSSNPDDCYFMPLTGEKQKDPFKELESIK